MNTDCLVSIITPSFNCSEFIAETIKSIQNQTYPNWELLITDDCSTDSSREIIQKFADSDPRIKLFCLGTNSGAGVARNNSIREAKGQYIAFCDSDDRWFPEKLEKQLNFMKEKDCALSYTSYVLCNENGSIIGRVKCRKKMTYLNIIRDNGIGCLSAIYNAQKIGKQYMPSIRKRQDWCLWIDIIDKYGTALGLQEQLAAYMVRKDSISSNKLKLLKYNYNVYHQILKKNKVVSAILLAFYFLPYYFYKKISQKFHRTK